MVSDIGKSVAIINQQDGGVINIFNKTCNDLGSIINFYDQMENVRYSIAADSTSQQNNYRCAYYTRSYGTSVLDMAPRLVVFIPPSLDISSVNNIPAQPLFQLICPSAIKYDRDTYFLTWWSNVDDSSLLTNVYGDSTKKQYVPSAIKKFNTNTLGDISENANAVKILCTAPIFWQNLRQVGGGVTDTYHKLTPVVMNPAIVSMISNEGYITDFSTGGDGDGGIGMHSHTNNADGGFAASVFMPSAAIRPLNWR